MPYITSTAQGLWTKGDQEYFRKHKARQWYIRDFAAGEQAMVSSSYKELYDALLARWQQDPSVPERAAMRVLVLQIRPGERMRVPTLDWPGRDKNTMFMTLHRKGPPETIILGEIPVRDFLADCRQMRAEDSWQQTPETQDPHGDFCNLCGREFITTQVNLHVRVDGLPKLACRACGTKPGMKIEAVGLFISNADMQDPARLEAAKATMLELVTQLKQYGLIKTPH